MLPGFTETCACVTQFPAGMWYLLRSISVRTRAAWICAGIRARQILLALRLRFKRDAQEAAVQVDVDGFVVGPDRIAGMIGHVGFLDHAMHLAKTVDHEMIAAVLLRTKLSTCLADALQPRVLARVEIAPGRSRWCDTRCRPAPSAIPAGRDPPRRARYTG